MSKVAVFGATGYAGSNIAAELLRRNHQVIGVARSEPQEPIPGVEYVSGSLSDPEFVAAVLAGVDVVVLAVRGSNVEAEGQTYASVVERLIPLLAGAGVRLGVVGGAGSLKVPGAGTSHMDGPSQDESGDQASSGPSVSNPGESVRQAELLGLLRGLGPDALDWFYVSPPARFGSYAPAPTLGRYQLGRDEMLFDAEGNSAISGADFALAIVDEIEHEAHKNMRFTVAH